MKNIRFLSENFHFSVVKLSIYLNRLVFVMSSWTSTIPVLHLLFLKCSLEDIIFRLFRGRTAVYYCNLNGDNLVKIVLLLSKKGSILKGIICQKISFL